MIREMVRIAVWGLASDKVRLVETLHELGVIHLLQPVSEPLSSELAGTFKRVSAKLLGLVEALEWNGWATLTDDDLESARRSMPLSDVSVIEELQRNLDEFSERLTRLQKERGEIHQELQSLRRALRIAHHLDVFWREGKEEGQEVLFWWIYRENQDEMLNQLRSRLSERKPGEKIVAFRHHEVRLDENDVVLAVSISPEFAGVVEEVFKKGNAVFWKPPIEEKDLSFDKALERMETRYKQLPARLEELDEDLKKARQEWGPRLGVLYILLNERLEEFSVAESVDLGGNIVFLEGWVPVDAMDSLVGTLREKFGDRVLLEWRYPTEKEWHSVPTALKNPPLFRPFELFLKLLPTAPYKGIDPTILIGIFFPFFSGCMIGDIGYGAVILALGAFLAGKRRPLLSDIGKILVFVSAWSIFWGVAYGEFFGDVGHRLFHMEPLWLERSEVVLPVMLFTLGLGVVHVILGLVLGLVQGLRSRQRHIWLEKLGNLIVIAGLIGAMVAVKGRLPDGVFTLSVTMLVVGVVVLIAGGGVGGLVESIGAVGNMLSYIRIAAIGLSSAILALVATQFVDVFGVTLLGVLIALAMHLLNFILALAGSGLHSARLQYVEFMGKFYSGGGKDYKPFARRRLKSWKKPS